MHSKFKQINFSDLLISSNRADFNKESKGNVIIGFDIDWASDFVIKDSLNLAYKFGIYPTLFLTHNSPFINKIYSEQKHEFGLHPNFERLLDGSDSNGENSQIVLSNLIDHFPNLKLVRSHSLTTSSRLKSLFKENGFLIESSFITHGTNEKFPKFWRDWSGLAHVPITWEDDVWFSLGENYEDPIKAKIIDSTSLNILTFHPIHLYLNTTNVDHYLRSKRFQNDPDLLIGQRARGEVGVRSVFKDIGRLINESAK